MVLRWVAAGLASMVLLVVGYFSYESVVVTSFQCDGQVPQWMIADDFDGGCLELRPSWEGNLPWNAGRMQPVCVGMGCSPSQSPRATPWEMSW
jgi:hypothetical protein